MFGLISMASSELVVLDLVVADELDRLDVRPLAHDEAEAHPLVDAAVRSTSMSSKKPESHSAWTSLGEGVEP